MPALGNRLVLHQIARQGDPVSTQAPQPQAPILPPAIFRRGSSLKAVLDQRSKCVHYWRVSSTCAAGTTVGLPQGVSDWAPCCVVLD